MTKSMTNGDSAERFAKRIGIEFHDLGLLRLALKHRSVVQDLANANPERPLTPEEKVSNERLEFLGDSILGYIAAEYLYKTFPDSSEGLMTAQRVALVRAEQLVRWARELELADYLSLGQGEKVTDGARDRMLAGAFEAIVGAITLDRGLRASRKFLRAFIDRDAERALADEEIANAKGRLQEFAQDRLRVAPVYHLLTAEGPDHARTFTVEVTLDGARGGLGAGPSKRIAEQAAAREALQLLMAGETARDAPSEFANGEERGRRRKRRRKATASPAGLSEKELDHVPVV